MGIIAMRVEGEEDLLIRLDGDVEVTSPMFFLEVSEWRYVFTLEVDHLDPLFLQLCVVFIEAEQLLKLQLF